MADSDTLTIDHATQRRLAVDLFNHTWTLLRLPERTPRQDTEMIHAAHASRHHWGVVGTAANYARGEWQVSHVYSVLGRGEPALVHARLCLAICLDHGIRDWDIAYAHEAMARAHHVAGNDAAAGEHARAAQAAAAEVADQDDREQVLADIADLL
jgi:hypothetical protein